MVAVVESKEGFSMEISGFELVHPLNGWLPDGCVTVIVTIEPGSRQALGELGLVISPLLEVTRT